MKTAFWFRLRLRRLRSTENWVVGVGSRSGRTKPITKHGNVHCDWFILPLLLPTPTIWFSLDRKRRSHKRSPKKTETFWFFRLRFRPRRAYDSAYNSDFWFSQGHERSYDSAYDSDSDSAASENQPLIAVKTWPWGTHRDQITKQAEVSFSHLRSRSRCLSVAIRSATIRLFEAGMKEAVTFLRIRSHKPRMWKVQVATRVEKLVGELNTSRAQFSHRSASTAQSFSCSVRLTFQFSSSPYKFDRRPWCAYNAFSFFFCPPLSY